MFHKITVDNIELGPIIRLMAVLFRVQVELFLIVFRKKNILEKHRHLAFCLRRRALH